MYKVNEAQIEFIINDIRRNGVEMEDLQLNLLDHICCIIEHELEENGDFEQFYFTVVKKFYKKELKEIEEETITLLIYKNYYVMKKIMIGSGIISVSLLTMGIILKFLYQPGASFGIVVGILSMSLIFLPLLFILKIKEKKEANDKVLVGLGTLAGIALSLGILFKVQHWPGANNLSLGALLILLLIFLPVYFFSGIRKQESKINTIISSLLIITGCGLFLTLVRSPQGSKIFYIQTTQNYLRNEELLNNEKMLVQQGASFDSTHSPLVNSSQKIDRLCNELKSFIIQCETGQAAIDKDFEAHSGWLEDSQVGGLLEEDQTANKNLETLQQSIVEYNKTNSKAGSIPPIKLTRRDLRSSEALNEIIQIQMYLLQNERAVLASK